MKRMRSIHSQIVGAITLIAVAGIGFIGLFSIKMIEKNAILNKVEDASFVARLIRHQTRPSASSFPAKVLDIVKETDIRDLLITDATGRVLLKDGSVERPRGRLMLVDEGVKVYMEGGGILMGVGEMLYVEVAPARGTKRVLFTMPLTAIKKEVKRTWWFLLFYIVLDAVIITVVGVYFLRRIVVDPLKRLEAAATRIAGGRLEERVNTEGVEEVKALATSFNTMAERIEEEIRRLNRVNRELATTQEELLRTRTLASLGRLAAGIAHEVGNPLGAVQGYLDILKKGVDNPEERQEILERTIREIERIDSLIKDFLSLSRPPAKNNPPVDVNTVLEDALSFLKHHREFKDIEVNCRLKQGLSRVIIDESRLRQVFINLLLNAAESMNGSGTVEITTGERIERHTRPLGSRRKGDPVFLPDTEERRFVCISIRDSGCGIDREDVDRIFEPFFTTKECGKGTGLGLFIARDIIKAHGGDITVESVKGEGTTFTIHLPAEGKHTTGGKPDSEDTRG